MKLFLILSCLSFNALAAISTIKFTAKTNGPGITVEGEVKNANTKVDFNQLNSTSITMDVMDLTTGMEKRDKHLHEKVFNTITANLAKIEYNVTNITCPNDLANTECDCVGILKIKDVKNEVKFKAKVNKTDKTIEGKTLVSLNQFHLPSPSFMGISVLDDVEIEFKVSAKN
jgi:polyisoprenoid-binding protein YceI